MGEDDRPTGGIKVGDKTYGTLVADASSPCRRRDCWMMMGRLARKRRPGRVVQRSSLDR